MLISKSLVPPGGWSYEEEGIKFEAQTFDELLKLVANYREGNIRPTGEPEHDIMSQIANKHKHLNIMQPNNTEKAKNFAHALKNYLANGGALVSQDEAARRAAICAGCHNNQPMQGIVEGGCSVCNKMAGAGLASLRKMVLGSRRTPSDPMLKGCNLCGCDLKLKVWFPKEYFDPDNSQANQWPTFCWMK